MGFCLALAHGLAPDMAVSAAEAAANVPDYLADADPAGLVILPLFAQFLRSSADVVLVVEGTELPCHSQVLASESRVFKDMLESTSMGEGAFPIQRGDA